MIIICTLQVQSNLIIFLNKPYILMAVNRAEIPNTIWKMIIKADIWTTNFVLYTFGNFMSYIMKYSLANLL